MDPSVTLRPSSHPTLAAGLLGTALTRQALMGPGLIGAAMCLLGSCSIQPIPSIEAPVDVVVSSLDVPLGLVVVAGRAGSVPASATVVVSGGDLASEVVAEESGAFALQVQTSPGTELTVFSRLGSQSSEALTQRVRGADEAGVPAAPGSAPGTELTVEARSDGDDVEIRGKAGAAPPLAELLFSFDGRARYGRADESGAFQVKLDDNEGTSVSVVAIVDGVASPAKIVVIPPGEDPEDPEDPEDSAGGGAEKRQPPEDADEANGTGE